MGARIGVTTRPVPGSAWSVTGARGDRERGSDLFGRARRSSWDMTARLEFLLGLVALIVAGLTMTTLYLRAKLRQEEQGDESLVSRTAPR